MVIVTSTVVGGQCGCGGPLEEQSSDLRVDAPRRWGTGGETAKLQPELCCTNCGPIACSGFSYSFIYLKILHSACQRHVHE